MPEGYGACPPESGFSVQLAEPEHALNEGPLKSALSHETELVTLMLLPAIPGVFQATETVDPE